MEQQIEIIDRAEFKDGKGIVEYSQTTAALAALRTKYSGVIYDLATTKGNEAARAARLELTTLRTSLEKKRKEFKSPALEFGKMIDAEAARITGEIVALETPIDEQIKADEKRRAAEKAEKERIAAERAAGYHAKIDQVRSFVAKCVGISSERIIKGIAQVELLDVSEQAFAEFVGEAATAKAETLAAMQTILAETKAREAEAARLEQQRIENERQAAELARQRAEIEAREKVILEAEERAKAEAAAAETLRIKRAAEDERRRQADVEARIQAEAIAARAQAVLSAAQETRRAEQPTAMPAQTSLLSPVAPSPSPAPAASDATVNLGQINAMLDGLSTDAKFLERKGFIPRKDGTTRLYRAADLEAIKRVIINHVESLDFSLFKTAA